MSAIILESVLTCPHCGFAKQEAMPPGDCCVFCSFGTVTVVRGLT
ncbi:hypothetical protein AB4Z35_25840 [Pseudomonas sp. KB_15]|nr:hypothetical protein [Pseudomonas sp. GM49]EJM64457.1 hypothetical protein PMI29_03041 [Pseudomonas sp. GM49]